MLLTEEGAVRYSHIGLHRVEKTRTRCTDIHSVAAMLHHMAVGATLPESKIDTTVEDSGDVDDDSDDDVGTWKSATWNADRGTWKSASTGPRAVLEKVQDPLKRDLLFRLLFADTKPTSAKELAQIIIELSPFDVSKDETEADKIVKEVEKRVQAATDESMRLFDRAWEKLVPLGGPELLEHATKLANKFCPEVLLQSYKEGISLKQVHSMAVKWCPQMLNKMRSLVEQAGGQFLIPPDTHIAPDDPTLSVEQCVETVKGIERATNKVKSDYNGDPRRLVDLVRASALFDTPTELSAALKLFESIATAKDLPAAADDATKLGPSNFLSRTSTTLPPISLHQSMRIVRAKDRLNKPVSGYRDLLLNIAYDVDGKCEHIGELQMHLRLVFNEKKTAHVAYDIGRTIKAMSPQASSTRTALLPSTDVGKAKSSPA